jgi:hypothetical protein
LEHYFAILRHDGLLDDYADSFPSNYDPNQTMRGLRLHSGIASHGCVTVPGAIDSADWMPIQDMIQNTTLGAPVNISGREFPNYGILTITGSGFGAYPGSATTTPTPLPMAPPAPWYMRIWRWFN